MKLKDFYLLCIDKKFVVEIFDFKECKTVQKLVMYKVNDEEQLCPDTIWFLHEYENRYLYAIYYDSEFECVAVTISVREGSKK